jgi:hypothetical protein
MTKHELQRFLLILFTLLAPLYGVFLQLISLKKIAPHIFSMLKYCSSLLFILVMSIFDADGRIVKVENDSGLIHFVPERNTFYLQGQDSSYVMQVNDGILYHVHWGSKINLNDDLSYLSFNFSQEPLKSSILI